MNKSIEAAGLYLLEGAVKYQLDALLEEGAEIKVGMTQLGDLMGEFVFPPEAGVSRAAGENGDGTNPGKPEQLKVTRNALILFLKRMREEKLIADSPRSLEIWDDCNRDGPALKNADELLPQQALESLELLRAQQPKIDPEPVPTSRKRNGEKEITFRFRRKPKDASPLKKRPKAAS